MLHVHGYDIGGFYRTISHHPNQDLKDVCIEKGVTYSIPSEQNPVGDDTPFMPLLVPNFGHVFGQTHLESLKDWILSGTLEIKSAGKIDYPSRFFLRL